MKATYDMRAAWDLRRFVFKHILHLVLSNECVPEERLFCNLSPREFVDERKYD